jgi:eukaryotic-like serine/threonine-protein kinase
VEQAKIPDRYRLIEEVGQGGMAVVYRAKDETLKREVAIKVLHQHLAAEPESKARLEREAQAVAKLRHENILEIFDYSGSASLSSYIVTEFIDGQTLKQFLADRAIGFSEVAALISLEVCGALAHAHGFGVIHRDVKPENVMIRKDGLIKLMDFGIAQVMDLQRMTVTGQLLGSPAYMAPEIIEGKQLDFRTDVFSVGITLYLLATGELPFSGKNPHEVLRRISDGRFADPRTVGRGVDETLSRIITRALARRPEDRYPDVGPLGDDLAGYLAAAGLSDVRAELRAYFADPPTYERALPARMAPALNAAAATALRERRSAKALELWNRVLVFDPQNVEVAAALRRFAGRERLRTAAKVLAGAAALGVVGVLAVRTANKMPKAPQAEKAPAPAPSATVMPAPAPAAVAPPPPPPSPPAPAPTSSPAAVPDVPRRAVAAGSRSARVQARVEPAVVAPPPRDATPVAARVFKLGPTPQNVDVYLDGQRQFGYDVDHTTISVPWSGVHVIEFRSPGGCCFVERVEVGPERPLPPDQIIARRLKWRPAHLTLNTDPPGTSVRLVVRDPARPTVATTARPGEEIDVPFYADDDSSKDVEIAIDSGESFTTEKIHVRAGQRLKHVVKMKTGGNER